MAIMAKMAGASVALVLVLLMCSSALSDSRTITSTAMEEVKPEYDYCGNGTWCVANPSADPEEVAKLLNDFCQTVSCFSIKPGERCFEPNTPIWHASVIYNDWWKLVGGCAKGMCKGAGTGIVVATDPSYGTCHFI